MSSSDASGNATDAVEKMTLNWMGLLDDQIPISRIKIPGTHNSTAGPTLSKQSVVGYFGGFAAKCQDMTIEKQLAEGIRYLDIRLILKGESLENYHGPCRCGYNFAQILRIVSEFLDHHKSEVVFLQIHRQDNGKQRNKNLSDEQFIGYINDHLRDYSDKIYNDENNDPLLGTVRGKMFLVLFKHLVNPQKHLHCRIFPVKKQWLSYVCKCNAKDQTKKLRAIESGMADSLSHSGLFANECNAVGSVKGMAFIPWPKRMAQWVNAELAKMLADNQHDFNGVLILDFPPSSLIKQIINLNLTHS